MTSVDLSLVIPTYNEAEQISDTLRCVLAFCDRQSFRTEVIVADDGSADQTVRLVESLLPTDDRLSVVANNKKRGKGAALRSGFERSRGRVVGFIDTDLPYSLENFTWAMTRIEGGADLVVGVRNGPSEPGHRGYSLPRKALSSLFSLVSKSLLHPSVEDTQCGIKVFRGDAGRALFRCLETDGFAFDLELLLLAERWSCRIESMPVALRGHSDISAHLLFRTPQIIAELSRLYWRILRDDFPNPLCDDTPLTEA